MRRTPVALTLVAVALTAAACGGGSGSGSSSTESTSAGASGGDAAKILSSLDTGAVTGPQKLALDLKLDIKGTPTDPQVALFTKQPIHLTVDGTVDNAKGGDVNVSLALGKNPINAEIRYGGGKSWVKIGDKWYDVAPSTLSSATGTSLPSGVSASSFDAGKLTAALGDTSKLFRNAKVSSDSVEGVDADKVSADVDVAQLGPVVSRLAGAAGSGQSASQAEVKSSMAELQKVVKNAHVDLWVGKDDHKVHRAVMTADAAMDAATQKSSGIDSVTFTFDATTVSGDAPDVSAPSSVGSQQEFQTALVSLLTGVMSGASTG